MCDPFFFLKIGSVAREQILEGDIWHTVADSGKSNLDSQLPDFLTFPQSSVHIESVLSLAFAIRNTEPSYNTCRTAQTYQFLIIERNGDHRVVASAEACDKG